MDSHESPQWKIKTCGHKLTRASCHSPPDMVNWIGIRTKHPLKKKNNQMHIFKVFEDQSDTYHDTQTHYLMEKDPFLVQD
jgi:hypothetical protein